MAFYLAGVTDPMEDRVKGFQPNQPIFPPTLPSHTTVPPRPVTRSNQYPLGSGYYQPSTQYPEPNTQNPVSSTKYTFLKPTQQLPSPIQAPALCICNLQLNYILQFNISQLAPPTAVWQSFDLG